MKERRRSIRSTRKMRRLRALCPLLRRGAIRIVDGKARLVAQKYCDAWAPVSRMPKGALAVIDARRSPSTRRPQNSMSGRRQETGREDPALRLPSSQMQTFAPGLRTGEYPGFAARRPRFRPDPLAGPDRLVRRRRLSFRGPTARGCGLHSPSLRRFPRRPAPGKTC